jgi:hypothetical protein
LEKSFDTIGYLFEGCHANRSLLTRLAQPYNDFLAVIDFSPAILFYHEWENLLHTLIGCKAALAVITFAPPARHIPFPT